MFGAYWKLPPHNAIQETFTQGRGKIRPQRHFPPFEKSSNKNLNFAESKIFLSGVTLNAIFIRKYIFKFYKSDIMLPKFEGEKLKLKTQGYMKRSFVQIRNFCLRYVSQL